MDEHLNNPWFNDCGQSLRPLPNACIKECCHSGDCSKDVKLWIEKLNFRVPRKPAIDWLYKSGPWELDTTKDELGLNDWTDDKLSMIVFWIACGMIAEGDSWNGLA